MPLTDSGVVLAGLCAASVNAKLQPLVDGAGDRVAIRGDRQAVLMVAEDLAQPRLGFRLGASTALLVLALASPVIADRDFSNPPLAALVPVKAALATTPA